MTKNIAFIHTIILKLLIVFLLRQNIPFQELTTIPPIHIFINRINDRLLLKIKDGYKLELQMPETIKLFGSTKKLIDKTKNGEKILRFEVVEVLLVQCNLVDNQYRQKSEVLHTFTPINLMLIC